MADEVADTRWEPGPQWEAAGGAYASVERSIAALRESLGKLEQRPAVIYEHAPANYVEKTLEDLRGAVAEAEWLRRVLIDEARMRGLLPQRAVAAASGVSYTTIQRWGVEPLLTFFGDWGPDAPTPPEHPARDR
jgi:hypothetical protein